MQVMSQQAQKTRALQTALKEHFALTARRQTLPLNPA